MNRKRTWLGFAGLAAGVFAAAPGMAGSAPGPQPPRTVPATPPPATEGRCRPNPADETPPEAVARRFREAALRQDRAAVADLLTPDARLFNGGANLTFSAADYLEVLGVGKAGRVEVEGATTVGRIVIVRSLAGGVSEQVEVVRTDGGCVAAIANVFDPRPPARTP
jgi:hypothetical protein